MKNGPKNNRVFRDFRATGKLNISYYRNLNMFFQIYTVSLPERTIVKDYSVNSYSGIWSNETARRV